MSDTKTTKKRRWRRVSPVGMLVLAGLIGAAFAVCHAFGARENLSVLFATSDQGSWTAVFFSLVYVMLYLGLILAVPVLVLAAGIFAGLQLVLRRLTRSGP